MSARAFWSWAFYRLGCVAHLFLPLAWPLYNWLMLRSVATQGESKEGPWSDPKPINTEYANDH